ncbi:MAG: glycogen/starch/alpha-glucan phosphorylase [Oscillospiraceae bacterium]|nr:glycogen/starch/alpha-glucan phosphorylase [Oscillospiraceae bacterium]
MQNFENDIQTILRLDGGVSPERANLRQLYDAVSKAAMAALAPRWQEQPGQKRACYLSAEFLLGRLVYSNLMNLGLLDRCKTFLNGHGIDPAIFEQIEDDALGNGGLGRLAACFLDSAATQGVPLDGFGIRYRYGLFRQRFEDGFQREEPDDWLRFGDPWSVRKEEEAVLVRFGGQTVKAVPYDMPVIGYGGGLVNTLRLWQAEAVEEFDFDLFNRQEYDAAVQQKNRAEDISAVLYPNDDTDEGRRLRLKQQYFFASATMQTLVRRYAAVHGVDFSGFWEQYAIQLNDTHPTVAIPELLRLLMEQQLLSFEEAFDIVEKTFAYTNHTIMAEALEKWNVPLFCSVLPEVYPYVVMLQNALMRSLAAKGFSAEKRAGYSIIEKETVHMARMAIFAGHTINGVAKIHTEILKNSALKDWYQLYPTRFQNKTNGITQRRWLALCNPELSGLVTDLCGDGWQTDLEQIKGLERFAEDPAVLERFAAVKLEKKRQLCAFVQEQEGVRLDPAFLFDVQIKRLHEYKRQLLNAFSILDLYFALKDGTLTGWNPAVFLFGAKAAPGYRRAKGIIKYIHEIAKLVNGDPDTNGRLQVVFVQNYNVSYAEKLIPAADVSEQISTAGTEASGTGNMKFMLNGAVTLGTLDGANIEIVEQAGRENNYIFGATVEELTALEGYDPVRILKENVRIRRVVDTLIDGTFSDGGTGVFQELYDSLTIGASWHAPDQYYLLLDFLPYCDAKRQSNKDYGNRLAFTKKCLINTANAGTFSSDRTIREYAKEIWGILR